MTESHVSMYLYSDTINARVCTREITVSAMVTHLHIAMSFMSTDGSHVQGRQQNCRLQARLKYKCTSTNADQIGMDVWEPTRKEERF